MTTTTEDAPLLYEEEFDGPLLFEVDFTKPTGIVWKIDSETLLTFADTVNIDRVVGHRSVLLDTPKRTRFAFKGLRQYRQQSDGHIRKSCFGVFHAFPAGQEQYKVLDTQNAMWWMFEHEMTNYEDLVIDYFNQLSIEKDENHKRAIVQRERRRAKRKKLARDTEEAEKRFRAVYPDRVKEREDNYWSEPPSEVEEDSVDEADGIDYSDFRNTLRFDPEVAAFNKEDPLDAVREKTFGDYAQESVFLKPPTAEQLQETALKIFTKNERMQAAGRGEEVIDADIRKRFKKKVEKNYTDVARYYWQKRAKLIIERRRRALYANRMESSDEEREAVLGVDFKPIGLTEIDYDTIAVEEPADERPHIVAIQYAPVNRQEASREESTESGSTDSEESESSAPTDGGRRLLPQPSFRTAVPKTARQTAENRTLGEIRSFLTDWPCRMMGAVDGRNNDRADQPGPSGMNAAPLRAKKAKPTAAHQTAGASARADSANVFGPKTKREADGDAKRQMYRSSRAGPDKMTTMTMRPVRMVRRETAEARRLRLEREEIAARQEAVYDRQLEAPTEDDIEELAIHYFKEEIREWERKQSRTVLPQADEDIERNFDERWAAKNPAFKLSWTRRAYQEWEKRANQIKEWRARAKSEEEDEPHCSSAMLVFASDEPGDCEDNPITLGTTSEDEAMQSDESAEDASEEGSERMEGDQEDGDRDDDQLEDEEDSDEDGDRQEYQEEEEEEEEQEIEIDGVFDW